MTPLFCRKKTLFLHDFYVTRPLFRLSTIAQKSQQSASRWRVLAFYRIAPCLKVWCAMFQTTWFLVLLCSVLRSVKKGRLVDYVKNKYGEGNVLKEICPKCSKKFKCFSAGIFENESGTMQYYAHFYIYLQIGVYSDLLLQSAISERY